MDLVVFAALAGAGLGALAAARAPLVCGWPSRSNKILIRRLGLLPNRMPAPHRRAAGAACLAALFVAGALTSYAAEAPERLPGEVGGVMGSGTELRLQIAGLDGTRVLKVGDAFAEGWVLSGLSPSQATLTRGPESRRVGLNPTGALAGMGDDAPLSQVQLAGLLPAQYAGFAAKQIALGIWDGKAHWGLSQDETARLIAYEGAQAATYGAWYAANWKPNTPVMSIAGRPTNEQAIGEGYQDWLALDRKRVAYEAQNMEAELAANPITGPDSFYIRPGVQAPVAAAEAGVDPRGVWSLGLADDSGARLMRRVAPAPYLTYVTIPAQAAAYASQPEGYSALAAQAQTAMANAAAAGALVSTSGVTVVRQAAPPTLQTAG